ncbi:MAG: phytanoyl-CoA dioxygenase family protein [Planctomycetota bacterium]|jgi:phytanoyl-CoA hydroxylase|nr:phytanoyl-CoA dioxygenase family protein [Planctomycetota bacterium]
MTKHAQAVDLRLPSIADISLDADTLDPQRAAAIYQEHGCLVVRRLMRPHLAAVRQDLDAALAEAYHAMDTATPVAEGWQGADGTLFIPAPSSFGRERQIMVLGMRYQTSAALLRSALDPAALSVVGAVLGPDVELFQSGQCLVKEAVGGHPKNLHQDAAYFEHRFEGPMAVLSYAVDTDGSNGALHVVPGSHRLGMLEHIDTSSHLALDSANWPWQRSLPICGQAGDSIFFHVRTIHGSRPNHSAAPRPVFIHRYRRPGDYVTVSGTSTANRGSAHAGADDSQRGIMVLGRRSHTTAEGDKA